jgi:hypothetical protein
MYFVVSYRRAAGTRFDSRYYVEQHIPSYRLLYRRFLAGT